MLARAVRSLLVYKATHTSAPYTCTPHLYTPTPHLYTPTPLYMHTPTPTHAHPHLSHAHPHPTLPHPYTCTPTPLHATPYTWVHTWTLALRGQNKMYCVAPHVDNMNRVPPKQVGGEDTMSPYFVCGGHSLWFVPVGSCVEGNPCTQR